jgi:hypothetical protein
MSGESVRFLVRFVVRLATVDNTVRRETEHDGGGGKGVVGGVVLDIGISGFLSKNVGMFLASYPYLHIDTQH